MEQVDRRIENEMGGSVAAYDERFAQGREAVEHTTPARLAAVREGELMKAEVERLSAKLGMLQESGAGQKALDAVEGELGEAVEKWSEFVAAEDGGGEVGSELAGYIPLADLLRLNLDTGRELDDHDREVRVDAFNALVAFVFQDGYANIWLAFKNFLAVTRRVKPDALGGVSKADLAVLLGESRAATCNREIRVIEKLLKGCGFRGFQLLGGTKSMTTRRRCAASAKGNQNRRAAR